MILKIKPLSVNQVWAGKRFKTKAYKDYEEELLWILPDMDIPSGKLKLVVEFGFSSKLADLDNPLKPFIDILQKKYGFNDKDIFELNVKKVLVKKGKEYIKWKI